MTRSEEELEVDVTSEPVGQARLPEVGQTEHVQESVPVTHGGAVGASPSRATSTRRCQTELPRASTQVLHEDRSDQQAVVPKERVRLAKEQVTSEEEVSADLRQERIDVEGDPRT